MFVSCSIYLFRRIKKWLLLVMFLFSCTHWIVQSSKMCLPNSILILCRLALRAASQPKCEAPLRNEVNQKRTNVRPLLSLLGSFGAIEWLSWAFFCHLHDHHKRGHLFSHGLGVSMPRPFRKGIACHGSMRACPFCYYGICCFIIWYIIEILLTNTVIWEDEILY